MLPHVTFVGLRVPTHELFTVLGFAVAGLVLARTARRERRWDGDLGWLVAGMLVGAAIFTKLGTVWRYVAEAEDPSVVGAWLYGGKSLLGGLAGAYIGVVVTKRLIGYRRSTGDLFAPAVAAGLAVGRIGCLLTEQIGTPTSLPWGITPSAAMAARIPNCPQCAQGVPLHPSFLYEVVFLALLFTALVLWRHRAAVEGDAFKLFLVAYAGFRFLVEFTRGNPELLWGLSGSQVFLLSLLPLTVAATWRRLSHRQAPPTGRPASTTVSP